VKSTNVLLTVKMNGEMSIAQLVNTFIVLAHLNKFLLKLMTNQVLLNLLILNTVKENGTVMIFITSPLKL